MHAATPCLTTTSNATIFSEHEVFVDCCHSNTAIYIFSLKASDRIRLDFFPSCIMRTAGPKIVENTSTLYHPGCGSQVQARTENWCRKPMHGFNFVPIRSHVFFPEWISAFTVSILVSICIKAWQTSV